MRRSQAIALLPLLLLLVLPAALAAAPKAKDAPPDRDREDRNGSDRDAPGAPDAPARADAPAPPDAADDRPSEADIQGAFDAGDYKGALQMLARVVNLRGAAGAAYDKHALWTLKAESHLRLKQLKPAGEAFGMAARETDDPVQAATARATQRMLAEAKAYRVTRRVPAKGKARSADVLDPEQRADALAILYEDERAATRPKVEAALKSRTLAPIAEALKLAEGLKDLELAATGGDADLSGLRRDLTERAKKLMSKELARVGKDVTAIQETARQPVERRRRRTSRHAAGDSGGFAGSYEEVTSRPRGLYGDDAEDLRAAIETCRQVAQAAESLGSAASDSVDPDEVQEIVDLAAEIARTAERTLDGRYGKDD
jgi:hypothetical protein